MSDDQGIAAAIADLSRKLDVLQKDIHHLRYDMATKSDVDKVRSDARDSFDRVWKNLATKDDVRKSTAAVGKELKDKFRSLSGDLGAFRGATVERHVRGQIEKLYGTKFAQKFVIQGLAGLFRLCMRPKRFYSAGMLADRADAWSENDLQLMANGVHTLANEMRDSEIYKICQSTLVLAAQGKMLGLNAGVNNVEFAAALHKANDLDAIGDLLRRSLREFNRPVASDQGSIAAPPDASPAAAASGAALVSTTPGSPESNDLVLDPWSEDIDRVSVSSANIAADQLSVLSESKESVINNKKFFKNITSLVIKYATDKPRRRALLENDSGLGLFMFTSLCVYPMRPPDPTWVRLDLDCRGSLEKSGHATLITLAEIKASASEVRHAALQLQLRRDVFMAAFRILKPKEEVSFRRIVFVTDDPSGAAEDPSGEIEVIHIT